MFRLPSVVLALLVLSFLTVLSRASDMPPNPKDWSNVLARARGQTVFWNAWAGEARTNNYIDWVAQEMHRRFDVAVEHVKLSDTSEAVSRVIAEKAAGRDNDGSVDLIWINGANFAAMKKTGLLFGPWAEDPPNFAYVDVDKKPGVRRDFAIPTDGLEAPWGMAQLVFYYDSARLSSPPKTMAQLLNFARNNPGRFTYPDPSNFLGATFLKQALMATVADKSVLQQPVSEQEFATITAPLWAYLDCLNPLLWRGGRAFPANSSALRALLADNEIDIALSFDPAEASASIARGELPDSVRTFVLEGGTIGNANFLAIPYNSGHKEGAMVLANFLLSPEAQARKQDPSVWGSLTVLAMDRLEPADRQRFETLTLGPAGLPASELGATLDEPHATWMTRIADEWKRRYGAS
jgi:putative thiamine transport system substrate-binding protein